MTQITSANLFTMLPHPYSTIFPSATGVDYDNLFASVKKLKRLRNPVIVYQGKILDGNQRIRVCRSARVEPRFIIFEGTDAEALDMVWDLNAARRHLTASQKAMAVAKSTLLFGSGERTDLSASGQVTDELAEKIGVGRSSVYDAKKVLREGTPKEIESVETGNASVKPVAEKIRQREKQTQNGRVVDDNGTSIPANAMPYWNRKPEARNVLNQISAARGQIKKLDPNDPMWANVNLNGVEADLNSAFNRFAAAIPAYVCPYCKGVKIEGCKCCKSKGVVSKFVWSTIPKEQK